MLAADDDCALVYGFLEAVEWRVRSHRLVFDPQRPGAGGQINLDGLDADQVAVVLNTGEARAFGGSNDLLAAVANLFKQTAASVVVVKGGASGCKVFQSDMQSEIDGVPVGACPTVHVWPLGSDDTFAAGFAHAWADGADPIEAARIGSAAAAYWCGTQNPILSDAVLDGDSEGLSGLGLSHLDTDAHGSAPRVYLAGPFFDLGELWLVDLVRNALLAQGVEVFSPLHDVGIGDESVARADIEGLRTCSAVLALLDGSDFGTVFEAGWAECADIPVVGYASRPDKEGAKMLTGLSGELHSDLSTAVYRAAWRALGAPALTRTSTLHNSGS